MKNPHAVALGRKGGSATSAAKTAAARANAKRLRPRARWLVVRVETIPDSLRGQYKTVAADCENLDKAQRIMALAAQNNQRQNVVFCIEKMTRKAQKETR